MVSLGPQSLRHVSKQGTSRKAVSVTCGQLVPECLHHPLFNIFKPGCAHCFREGIAPPCTLAVRILLVVVWKPKTKLRHAMGRILPLSLCCSISQKWVRADHVASMLDFVHVHRSRAEVISSLSVYSVFGELDKGWVCC